MIREAMTARDAAFIDVCQSAHCMHVTWSCSPFRKKNERTYAMSSWQQIQLTTNRTGSWMYYIPLGTRVVSGALLQTMDRTASFYRATRMHSADYAVARCPFVCPSVCPSHSSMLSTPLNISLFFYHQVAPPFWFVRTKQYGGHGMQGGMKVQYTTQMHTFMQTPLGGVNPRGSS